jgi:hypothetical protein
VLYSEGNAQKQQEEVFVFYLNKICSLEEFDAYTNFLGGFGAEA